MHRRDAIRRVAATGAALAFPAFAQASPLVLGQSAPLTGPAGELGLQMNAGARIFFNALNAQGGVGGTPVELRVADDGYEPDRCKANTEKFIRDDVFGLFGYVGTPTSLAALPLVVDAKMPFFAPVTGAEALRDPLHKTVFHLRASYFDETALIVKQLTALGLTRIGVFYQNDAYGKAGLEGMTRALKAHQLSPVALGTVERNSIDVAQAVKDIAPKTPEAVVQISAYKSCAAFIRASRKAGYGGQFFNVSFVGTQALADELGKDANGIVVSQVVPFPFSMATPIAREYLDAVHKAGGGVQPNYSSMEGYLAAKVLAEGLKRAGRNPTRESLVTGLESIQNLDAGGFLVRFGAHSHVASSFVELSMLTGDGKVRR
jgi:ABC-type branched-subunit amino acid transport system substrate-binding protein